MSDVKVGDDARHNPDILAVLQLLGNLTKQEKTLIRDLPDHFRRVVLHTQKADQLLRLLHKSIDGKRWQEKDELFSLVAQLLAELDPKTGVVTKEVYEMYGFFGYQALLQQDEKALAGEEKLTLELYHKLYVVSLNRSKKLVEKTEKIRHRLEQGLRHEKIALAVDVHLENLLNSFRDLLGLQQEIIRQETTILLKLRMYEAKVLIFDILADLKIYTDKFSQEIVTLQKVELRLKNEFYLPFQKFHDEKVTSLDIVNNLLSTKTQKWYHRLGIARARITLKEVMLEYRTMTTPEEVLDFFGHLEHIPQFLEPRVLQFINEIKPKVIAKIRSTRSLFQRKLWEKNFDALTGAFSKDLYYIEFDRLAAQYERLKLPFSLLAFDIDFFKKFNDKYGHIVGDKVLQSVAKTIMKHARKSDMFIRFGGEEFLLLLPNTNKSQALVVANKINQFIPAENPQPINPETKMAVTISIGVATFPQDGGAHATAQDLLARADAALYEAKNTGRNRVVAA